MKRREFVKKIGIGSAALTSLPTLAQAFFQLGDSEGDETRRATGFRFVCVSQADRVGEILPRINMNGCATFNHSRAQGGGSYNEIDQNSPVPRTLFSAGRWDAGRVLSVNIIGTCGVLAAGTLEMEVRLLQQIPHRAVIPARLRVVCGIGACGFDPGEEEGFVLTIPGHRFGPYRPFEVAPGFTFGITIFTTGEQDD